MRPVGKTRAPVAHRFWQSVQLGDDCWEWLGRRNDDGYGQMYIPRSPTSARYRTTGAHRVSWELAFGPVPEGLWVLHRCDNRRCVRPDHLFLGDQFTNMQDMATKGRGFKANGQRNGRAKLSPNDIQEIRRRKAEGEGLLALSKAFGVNKGHIWRICAGINWSHQ